MKTMRYRFVSIVVLMCLSLGALAQTSGTNSAYSRYGWGNRTDVTGSLSLGMEGVSLGRRGSTELNFDNPASLSAIDSLTFLLDVGMSLTMGRMKYGSTSVSPNNSTFDYATAGFRLFRHLGFAVSLQPYTYIGYSFSSDVTLEDVDGYGENTAYYNYLGEGGTHKIMGALGWEPFKGVAIGATFGYLWGDYEHTASTTFSSSNIQSLYRYYIGEINSYTLDLGAQLTFKVAPKAELTLGFKYGFGHKINQTSTFMNQKTGSGAVVGADTTVVDNSYELPSSFGVGAMLNLGEQWLFGVDYTMEKWEGCRFPTNVSTSDETQVYSIATDAFTNRHRVAVGGQYMPDPRSFRWRDHITYRLGVSYTTPYAKVDGADGATTYSVSAGVGLPINNRYTTGSILSVGVQYQHMEPSAGTTITEDYFSIRVGLLFNGRWFQKWKVE